jgi:heme oxygenase
MLERTDGAECSLRPARLLEALRERTADLHKKAERSGIIADILHGRADRDGYILMMRNLLPVYQALEHALQRLVASPVIAPIARPELARANAVAADLAALAADWSTWPLLPEAGRYVDAIVRAAEGDGSRLIAHAYARYLGDLSGGQILRKLLARSLGLPPDTLSFYVFADIGDLVQFKDEYRAAIDRAGDEVVDTDAVVEEGARAFELNIALSTALQAAAARRG